MAVDGTRYTCKEALAGEIERLFRGHPLPVAFGCEVAEPGDFLTLDIAGVPVMLIRDDEGTVRGLLNTCRHRGARLLDGAGQVGKALVCPYHNWTYDRCGVLTAQPGAEHFPNIAVGEETLVRFPTEERDGFVWLLLDPAGTLDLDEALGDFGAELAAFGLANYRHRGSHAWTKRMNWKLGVDTFLEYYHVPILHRASIGKRSSARSSSTRPAAGIRAWWRPAAAFLTSATTTRRRGAWCRTRPSSTASSPMRCS